jgi:hypothetical protein
MNIGEAVTAPFQYNNWFPKIAKASIITCLLFLVPLAGGFLAMFNLLGWGKAIAEERLRGNTTELPDYGFAYLGEGARIFVGQLLLNIIVFVALIPLMIVFGVLGAIAGQIAEPLALVVSIIGGLAQLALSLLLGLATPIIVARIMFDGDTTAAVRIVDALKLARANLGTCVMFIVTGICIYFVGIFSMITVVGIFIFAAGYFATAGAAAIAQFRQSGVN